MKEQVIQPPSASGGKLKKVIKGVLIGILSILLLFLGGFYLIASFLLPKGPADTGQKIIYETTALSPGDAAKIFLDDLLMGRFDKIYQEELASDAQTDLFLGVLKSVNNDLKGNGRVKNFTILDETIVDNAASVAVDIKTEDGNDFFVAVYFKKERGGWKVYDIGI